MEECGRPRYNRFATLYLQSDSYYMRVLTHGDPQPDIPIKVRTGVHGEGWTDANGYRRIGNKREHRLVMEQSIGRSLEPDEHVHHKNGVRADNRLANLELWVTRRQPPGQRVSERITDAMDTLRRYAPDKLAHAEG